MPEEEAIEEEEEEEEEAIEEEPIALPSNPPAASTTRQEDDPKWLAALTQRLDHIDGELSELKQKVKHSRPRPRPVVEKVEEPPITGNRQERKRKRNQRRILGKLARSGTD